MQSVSPVFQFFVLAACLCAAGSAWAAETPLMPERSELPESVLRAERQTGGEVLRAERMQRDGREVYRLKVLTPDGRVRIMRDDPRERRRDAWRNSRAEPGALERQLDDRSGPRDAAPAFEPRPAAVPSDLGMLETLPPVERGELH